MKSKLLALALLAVLSALCAFVGLGRSYYTVILPNAAHGELRGISGDGWIQDGAQIRLSDLGPRFNRIVLNLDPGPRPASSGIAELELSVCGVAQSVLPVSKQADFEIALRGECEPRVVSIGVKNPYIPSERDPRKLGVQLRSATVGSRLVWPILNLELLASVSAALFIFSALLFLTGDSLIWRLSSIIAPLCGAIIIANSEGLELRNPYALWLF